MTTQKQQFRFSAQRNAFSKRGIHLFGGIADQNRDGRSAIFANVTLIDYVDDGMIVDPFISMDEASAQDLFDALYSIGLRPSREERVNDARENSHICDLREIAFKLLKIERAK